VYVQISIVMIVDVNVLSSSFNISHGSQSESNLIVVGDWQ
jgi:hypothetical protein